MEHESDYIKRSIELYKYLFSSSAALLLIIVWKTLTDVNILTTVITSWFLTISEIVITLCVGTICWNSFKKWNNLVEELK